MRENLEAYRAKIFFAGLRPAPRQGCRPGPAHFSLFTGAAVFDAHFGSTTASSGSGLGNAKDEDRSGTVIRRLRR